MHIDYYFNFAAAIACAAAFVILLLGKTGIRDRIVSAAPRLVSEMFGCDFCLGFWLSLIFAASAALFFGEPTILLTPIISAPITRFLVA